MFWKRLLLCCGHSQYLGHAYDDFSQFFYLLPSSLAVSPTALSVPLAGASIRFPLQKQPARCMGTADLLLT